MGKRRRGEGLNRVKGEGEISYRAVVAIHWPCTTPTALHAIVVILACLKEGPPAARGAEGRRDMAERCDLKQNKKTPSHFIPFLSLEC